jgi:hypothetical protein
MEDILWVDLHDQRSFFTILDDAREMQTVEVSDVAPRDLFGILQFHIENRLSPARHCSNHTVVP